MAANVNGKSPDSIDDSMAKEEQHATVDTHVAQYTAEEERQVLRKIDFYILPFVSDFAGLPNGPGG